MEPATRTSVRPHTGSLLRFLDESPCNFLAVDSIARILDARGFRYLDPSRSWDIEPGGRYYTIKNSSAIFAFTIPSATDPAAGYRIISAHSDSPGFRIKPNPEMLSEGGMLRLNTEVYGGPILYTWFDRPLSVVGRVILRSEDPFNPITRLIKISRPLLTIPHLAIHFNRAVNEGNPLSKQKDMMPLMALLNEGMNTDGFLCNLIAEALDTKPENILDMDLTLYDTTPATLFGADDEFISSGRIDDLMMAHAAVMALADSLDKDCPQCRVVAIFDNEETGSGTKQGAASPVLQGIISRINDALGGGVESYERSIAQSFMISADNAHATHPNYPEKMDPTNHPVLGGGPVIKINANCKYMTDADSAAVFRTICEDAGVPFQYFVNHSDSAGGSTLGNILTSQLPLRGVDMGAPQLAMHSCRETAAVADHLYTIEAFTRFFSM